MIQDFYIGHRRKPRIFTSEVNGAIWGTCLRSLAFTHNPQSLSLSSEDELYSQQRAYGFLLEIVCGLHSPILGETEVFGQFKNFAQDWLKSDPKKAPLVQKILSDAKLLRSRYLCNLGTQSYGSWIKRHLQAGPLHILGAGQLVQEIFPHLQKRTPDITLHVREPLRSRVQIQNIERIAPGGFQGGALIIAAPMLNSAVMNWLGGTQPQQIFDLRDTSSSDPLQVAADVKLYRLHDIFAEIERTKLRLHPIVDQVKQEIACLSERLASHALVRPQGWDDLCA